MKIAVLHPLAARKLALAEPPPDRGADEWDADIGPCAEAPGAGAQDSAAVAEARRAAIAPLAEKLDAAKKGTL